MSKPTTINKRLNALPPKVSMPLRQLLEVGQLDEATLAYILDAGNLTGETTKLLGFAVGFLHLRSHGVPVHDVITMAKQLGRRINLSWSASRWQTEHDRLSRAEALARLAKDNVAYDVSKIEVHLPERFDGYLVRTSRRLGMEGLRQRHCVASYHPQLLKGTCAIASLFLGGQRWTVQVATTGKADAPLSIQQVRTRHNGVPDRETREAIAAMLGIAEPKPETSQGRSMGHAYLETLQALLPILREHGVTEVEVRFEGYGDSGAIEGIWLHPPTTSAVKDVEIDFDATKSSFEQGRWVSVRVPKRGTVADAIEALTYDYLEETGVDWYNNDGGFGELRIDVASQQFSMEVNVRYTDSTNEYCAERCILTGDWV